MVQKVRLIKEVHSQNPEIKIMDVNGSENLFHLKLNDGPDHTGILW